MSAGRPPPWVDRLRALPPADRQAILSSLTARELAELRAGWEAWSGFWAREDQLPPDGVPWTFWLLLGGRGSGKTHSAANWVIHRARTGRRRIHVIAATGDDARTICVEGESGLLENSPDDFRPIWEPSIGVAGELRWPNGSRALFFGAEEPKRFRGPQCDTLWACDVPAWGVHSQKAWDMAMLGFRLGDPKCVIDMTPGDEGLALSLITDPLDGLVVSRSISDQNAGNLAPSFFSTVLGKYAGTRMEQVERYGREQTAVEGCPFQDAWIKRIETVAVELTRVVVAVDPALFDEPWSDETGIVVAGLGSDGRCYVLADYTGKYTPEVWAGIVRWAFEEHEADMVVAEVNAGGNMVESTLRAVAPRIPIEKVNAKRGKILRAEPLAHAYSAGLVSHLTGGAQLSRAGAVQAHIVEVVPVGDGRTREEREKRVQVARSGKWPTLEQELTTWNPARAKSPNGIDALAYAHAALQPFDVRTRERKKAVPYSAGAEKKTGMSWLKGSSPGHSTWLRGR